MPFDLNSPRITNSRTDLISMSQYLEQLKAQGHIQSPRPVSRRGIAVSNAAMATLDATIHERIQAEAPSPPLSARSWHRDVHITARPPARVIIQNANAEGLMPREFATMFVFGELVADTTVGELVRRIRNQLLPGPSTVIRLEHWGEELDDARTLISYKISEDSRLALRLSERTQEPDSRGLTRLRLTSTVLRTRALEVEPGFTGFDLKQRVCAMVDGFNQTWWTHGISCHGTSTLGPCCGKAVSVCNAITMMSVAEGGGEVVEGGVQTASLKKGEEVLMEPDQIFILRNAKGTAISRRVASGAQADVAESQLVELTLLPEAITLSWRGIIIKDSASLWDLGLRQDDMVALEFEPPVMPDQLRILRSPAPEKKKGGKKGGKKKK